MNFSTKLFTLGLSIALLFSTSLLRATTPPLPDPLKAGWKGASVCEKLHEDKRQRVLRCTFPPGVGHERHYHVANFGYAISAGHVRITDAKGVREVKIQAGSNRMSDAIPWHEIINIGKTTIIYLIIELKEPADTINK